MLTLIYDTIPYHIVKHIQQQFIYGLTIKEKIGKTDENKRQIESNDFMM